MFYEGYFIIERIRKVVFFAGACILLSCGAMVVAYLVTR